MLKRFKKLCDACTCLAFLVSAHVCTAQFTDNFSDGDFVSNPIWSSNNLANWTIQNNQLQSNSSVASSSFYITTPSTKATSAQWEFYVNLQFNTSSANFVDIFLTSSLSDLTNTSNSGYFVRIGGTPDEISLYKLTAGVPSIIINGLDGVTNSSNNTLRIKVVRDANNLWQLERDITGTGNSYMVEGTINDNTFTTSNFFGVRIQQSTSSFFNKHFFDDFYVGDLIVDTQPPTIVSVAPTSATTLTVEFSERVESTSAQTVSNYSVNNSIGSALTATLQPDQKTVHVTFAQSFPNAATSMLTVNGVKDLLDNTITTASQNFFFFQPVAAASKDIIITEIFPDPSPVVGLPEAEFVEIHNRSDKVFDLQNWKITDGSSTGLLPAHLIFPGDYFIICSTSSLTLFNPLGTALGVSNFPTLNNSGDALTLKDNLDVTIDQVNYNLTWYRDEDKKQGGFTLELIDPINLCGEEDNWIASESANGGTPASQNSVYEPDVTGPKLVSATPTSPTEIIVHFNERLDSHVPALTDFIITPSVSVSQILLTDGSLKSLQLSFSNSLQPSVMYSIEAKNIYDCSGNAISIDFDSFVFVLPEIPDNKDIIITEIFADPSPVVGLPEAEFIEILNRSNKVFDLQNWKITDGSSAGTLPSHLIFPGEYIIITSESSVTLFNPFGTVLGVPNFPTLNNSGEALTLIDNLGVTVDQVNYNLTWYRDEDKKQGGYSLELIDPANPCGEEGNWTSSEGSSGGTPGAQNSVFENKPDLTGPKFVSAIPISATEIVVHFNEKLDPELPALTSFTIAPYVSVSQILFTDGSLKSFQLSLNTSLEPGVTYSIEAQNIYDCNGNVLSTDFDNIVFGFPEIAYNLDIVISEILFNPRPTGVDFVEVHNNSEKFINLKNWSVANYENGIPTNARVITTEDFLIEPNRYLVFTENGNVVKGEYILSSEENLFTVADLPGLNDDAGTVALIDPGNNTIDFFNYSDDYHSVFIDDNEGVSLERISFTTPTNEVANWKSASSTVGFATPGFVNSNVDGEQTANKIMISPEIFEPITGQPNFTQIQYNFEQGGFVANIKILDFQGREIKQIVNNAILGTEGFFRWDGDTNEGSKARTGYYTIWFEVFNANGQLNTYRKRVVIASKR